MAYAVPSVVGGRLRNDRTPSLRRLRSNPIVERLGAFGGAGADVCLWVVSGAQPSQREASEMIESVNFVNLFLFLGGVVMVWVDNIVIRTMGIWVIYYAGLIGGFLQP